MMTNHDKITVVVDGMPEVDGMRLVDLIADLQKLLASIPEEHKGAATVHIHAYDWEGTECVYEREPTAAESERRDAIFADRKRLIEATPRGDYLEWVRRVRLRTGADAKEAEEFIKSDESANTFHPKYNWKTAFIDA
jgi:hypothetical protein